jgi:hypothetical protein
MMTNEARLTGPHNGGLCLNWDSSIDPQGESFESTDKVAFFEGVADVRGR